MRSAPSVSSWRPDSVSDQRTLRPTRSEASQPSDAVLASAQREGLSHQQFLHRLIAGQADRRRERSLERRLRLAEIRK